MCSLFFYTESVVKKWLPLQKHATAWGKKEWGLHSVNWEHVFSSAELQVVGFLNHIKASQQRRAFNGVALTNKTVKDSTLRTPASSFTVRSKIILISPKGLDFVLPSNWVRQKTSTWFWLKGNRWRRNTHLERDNSFPSRSPPHRK